VSQQVRNTGLGSDKSLIGQQKTLLGQQKSLLGSNKSLLGLAINHWQVTFYIYLTIPFDLGLFLTGTGTVKGLPMAQITLHLPEERINRRMVSDKSLIAATISLCLEKPNGGSYTGAEYGVWYVYLSSLHWLTYPALLPGHIYVFSVLAYV